MDLEASSTARSRQRLSLDGEWQFRHETGNWRPIAVPGVWQAQFDDLRLTGGNAVYKRLFDARPWPEDHQMVLHFEAVNYLAEVYLNGRHLGSHEGGWLPFEFTVDPELLEEKNDLEVRVTLPSALVKSADRQPSFAEIPHGKQSWYGPLSGIWQPVWIEARDPVHLRCCRIFADLASGRVTLETTLSAADGDVFIQAMILDPDGDTLCEIESPASGATHQLSMRVHGPSPWSPAKPSLYMLAVTVRRYDQPIDSWREQFGFRTIETREGRFYLNGEPLYLRGALDQDYYPETLILPSSVHLLEEQITKAKAMSFNCLRCHIKVPDPRYYQVADRLGMLVWSEIPSFAEFSEAAAERMWATMQGVLDRDGNHPSIIAWTIVNEDWGTELDEDPEHRAWLIEAYKRLKALDPTRLVVDNSPCFPNFHVRTDINDFHYYRAIPDHRDEWDWITEQFASRPSWSFAPDGQQTGEEPLVVSEFGLWGLPNPEDLRDRAGREPWWFETGELFGDGAAYPHGVERRYTLMGLDRVFGNFENFLGATQQHQFNGLKYQIEKLREHGSIQGYVVTELTDVYWEANGLMDMRRNPRLFAQALAEINSDLVILPRLQRYAYWCGQTLRLSPAIATGGELLEEGSTLDWSLGVDDAMGRVDVAPAGPCTVAATMPIEVTIPLLDRPSMVTLRMVLRDSAGRERAGSSTDIALYPRREAQALPLIWTTDEEIAAHMRGLGYGAAATAGAADLIIVRAVDTNDVEAIRTGARYLLLADGPGKEGWLRADHPVQAAVPTVPAPVNPPFPGIMRRIRRGNVWRGDWITNFGWLARHGLFSDIPGGPMLDLTFDRVAPAYVLWASIRPWEYEAGIMPSGVVVGWVHKPAGFIMQRRFGRGRLVMSSFRLTRDEPELDPVATALIDRLVRTALVP
jgi:hypothetical protein